MRYPPTATTPVRPDEDGSCGSLIRRSCPADRALLISPVDHPWAFLRSDEVEIIEARPRLQVVLEADSLALEMPVLRDVDDDRDLAAMTSDDLRALDAGHPQ